jgi:2-haloacid dehalogenase
MDKSSTTAIRAVVFDAYGTLFDVHSAVAAHAARLGQQAAPVSDLWRVKQLEYTWTRSLIGRYRDFRALTEEALDYALARFGIIDRALRADLLAAYMTLAAYPDVPVALSGLRALGLSTAILSNGSPDMLAAAVTAAGLGDRLDAVISVHEIGTFKPPAAAYEPVLRRLDVVAREVVFVSSNRWDIAGAAAFGFRPVWCNRARMPDEYADLPPVAAITDLGGLAAWVQAARSG